MRARSKQQASKRNRIVRHSNCYARLFSVSFKAAVDTGPDMKVILPNIASAMKEINTVVKSELSNGGSFTLANFSEVQGYRSIKTTDAEIDKHLDVGKVAPPTQEDINREMAAIDASVKDALSQELRESANVQVNLEHGKLEILKVVNFQAAKADFAGDATSILDDVAGVITAVTAAFDGVGGKVKVYPKFSIEGHTFGDVETEADKRHMQDLSDNRAATVCKYVWPRRCRRGCVSAPRVCLAPMPPTCLRVRVVCMLRARACVRA